MVKFCDQCGTQLNDDDSFCHNCGVACDISKRKTQNNPNKTNTILSDLGVDNIIQGVSNYQKNQNIRREAIKSKKQIETKSPTLSNRNPLPILSIGQQRKFTGSRSISRKKRFPKTL